ncbi:hypothetical protein SMNM65_12170 [Streptococcus mitis]|uniref:G5 domain-containing protein n=1 Tax=Streptococcus mitis TaxID=28037 RepID=A0A7G1ITS3_STRMT|nr:hypothetical protein SMNM65_12170 [Streptococcus mitis]
MSRQSTKNKKYALRKIGKYFGSCVVATVITLGGVAMMAPNVTVYASDTFAAGEADIENITSASDGYEVFVPKGKKYERDDKVESHEPVLREKGYNGRSFIVKADESENLTKEDIDNYFSDNSMESLFEKLYDKDDNDQIDEKYKRADADTINENAGKPIGDSNFVEPKVSEVNPKYPHRLDAGVSTPANPGNLYEGRPAEANGSIDSDDTIVESNNPITVNPNSEDNIVNDDGTVVLSKYYRIHVNKGEHADKKDDIYVVGTKPKVVETPIPYPTRYVEDNTKDKDYRETTQAGVRGKEITTTTYTLDPNTGTVTENTPTVVREEPTEEIITVGTKPKVVETPIPYTTRYVEDNTKDKDYRETTQTGVKGKETTTTTYTMDPNTGTVTENTPTVVREEPTEEIITVGTKPKVVETPIPYTTRYVEDNTKDKDYRETTQTGVKGKETTTTTYTMDPNTGTVTENTPTVVREEPTEEIITVGTKPKVVETPIPYTTRYVEDNTKDKDYRETTQTGVKGKETTTTTYTMDPNTGTVTENTPTVVREEPTEEIITVGTKPKVVETPIPYTTRYVEDNTKDKDYRETTQAGVKGKETTTTTYTMDPNTGTVTENTPTVVREEPTEEIITVGTKPKVVETPIPYTTRYVEDNTKDKDYRETTQAGVKGKETTTTTYTMDPNTGTVTENTPTVVREEPTEEIITVGTKPKVVETPIPYTTRYVEDNTKDKDYRETTQTGVKGKETTTTTYTMDPNTGTVTENTPTVVREEPTEEIITVGTNQSS